MEQKLLDENSILQMQNQIDNNYEFVENFNKHNCVTKNTRLIIVGTITPPKGMENGYFYTAPRNRIYGYIDEAKGTNLKTLKKSLFVEQKNSDIVNQIKEVLKENNIAFLDIMKYSIRKKDSPYDADIVHFALDIESFKNTPFDTFFICNSKLAETGYLTICKNLNRKVNYIYLSQRFATKKEWVDAIKNHLQ